jgi:hypothetical protein
LLADNVHNLKRVTCISDEYLKQRIKYFTAYTKSTKMKLLPLALFLLLASFANAGVLQISSGLAIQSQA